MADVMQFDLVSPERNLVSAPVREVRLPGTEGDLTAMPGHAPAVVSLRPGLVTVVGDKGDAIEFAISGGFAEISGDAVILLAEQGRARADMTQDVFNDMMETAYRKLKQAETKRGTVGEEVVTAAAKLLGDMEALGTHIGLDPNQANFPK